MWEELPKKDREEYKRMILAFASLTEVFAQKAEESDEIPAPIINSKYQETIFQKAFHASGEDIGNTSYDVAISEKSQLGRLKKYLIGIKTFGIGSGDQKVAQFKANISEWAPAITEIQQNAKNSDGSSKTKAEIDRINHSLYERLAKEISRLRNERINSSIANLQGFTVDEKDDVESVYHVLMPSPKGHEPEIHVGETSYDKINIDNIQVLGCSNANNPANFSFSDGNHIYRYTSADSQLYMKFNNENIVVESWPVRYAEDAYGIFSGIANKIYGLTSSADDSMKQSLITESYSWKIANANNEVEKYSGFNGFYGVGSKLGTDMRESRIRRLYKYYSAIVEPRYLENIIGLLKEYLLTKSPTAVEKEQKIKLREEIVKLADQSDDAGLRADVKKLIFRPKNEMYIPIPNSREFHANHPNFFGNNVGYYYSGTKNIKLDKHACEFNLVFEPSGDVLRAFITQDNGKAIESVDKQTILGEWILSGVFQLGDYEPLTYKKLVDLGINGIRLYKIKDSSDIHLEFIWIGDDLPDDYVGH